MNPKLKRNSSLSKAPIGLQRQNTPQSNSNASNTALGTPGRVAPKSQMIPRSLSDEKLIEAIEGFAFPIQTPFGRVLSLSADLCSHGRSIREIEDHISKYVRPFLNYATRRSIFGDKVREHAKKNAMQQMPCSSSTHECMFLPPADETEPFRRISNLFLEQLRKEKKSQSNSKVIHVYLQNNQSYSNVMPWLANSDRFRLITLEADESGAIKTSTIVSTVLKHASKSKYHIIQLQAESSKTKQRMDLTAFEGQIEALKQEYPTHQFTCILEATPLFTSPGYTPKDQEDAMAFFDFIVIRLNRFLGGQLASNLILAKRQTLTEMKVNIPVERVMEPTAMLRTAQVLEFYKDNEIPDRMKNSPNSTIFFEEIASINERLKEVSLLNKIDLGNITEPSENGRYSITILQEGSETFLEEESRGYPVLLAHQLTILLHDLFGIQVKPNRALKSTKNMFKFFDIPVSVIDHNGDSGFVELNSSTIDLDIHFLMTPQEVLYIATALEQITLYAPKLMKLYNKKLLKPKHYIPPEVDLTFKACASFKYHEVEIEDRSQTYANQLIEASKILRTPANYFTISESWKEDKSVVFPLSAFPNSFPTKNRNVKIIEEGATGDEEEEEEDDETLSHSSRSINKKDLSNTEAVQEARDLINRIKNNIPETTDSPLSRPSSLLVPLPAIKLQELSSIVIEEENNNSSPRMATEISEVSEELLAQIRRELKEELSIEVREEMEDSLKMRWAIREEINLKEQVKQKERRVKNLRIIFNFYAQLKDVLADVDKKGAVTQQAKKASISASNSSPSLPGFPNPNGSIFKQKNNSIALAAQQQNKRMAVNKFFKFCDDFELISPTEIDIKTLYKLFEKVCPPGQTEIEFTQFQILIEKLSHVLYQIAADEPDGSSVSAPTHYDKQDLLSRRLGLDDPQFYKHKLKEEGLINFSFVFHDKHQLFSQSPGRPYLQSKLPSQTTINTNSIQSNSSKQPSISQIQDWSKDPSSMDARLLYKDSTLSHQDVLSEVISLSQPKNLKSHGYSAGANLNALQQAQRQSILSNSLLANNSSNSNINGNNSNNPRSLRLIKDNSFSMSPAKPYSIQSSNNLLSHQPYQQNESIQLHLLKRVISDATEPSANSLNGSPLLLLSPTVGEASTRKKQMLIRAKQIASAEKEKEDSLRMKSLPTEYSEHEVNSPSIIRVKHGHQVNTISKFDQKPFNKLMPPQEPPVLPFKKRDL